MSTYTVNSLSDIHTWIINNNPGNVTETEGLTDRLARAIQADDDHPPYGEDWGPWLNENADSIAETEI